MTDIEYKKLVGNINRQLRRLEEKGYTKLSSGYQAAQHATQRLSALKTGSGKVRFSTAKSNNTERNVRMLQSLAKQLSAKPVTEKIKQRAEAENISTFTAKAELEAEVIFNNMVETLSAFYDSKQVSDMLHEYDGAPTFEQWLHDVFEREGQLLHDRSPEDFDDLASAYAQITGRQNIQQVYKEFSIEK